MKQLFLFFSLIGVFTANGQNPVPPALGDGSIDDPYQISTLDHLAWFSMSADWSQYFIQTANIDASATSSWNGGLGFDPIGGFWGHYDGNYHTISGLTVNRTSDTYAGFFAEIWDGSVSNVVLQNVNIKADRFVGALAGRSAAGVTISRCYASGSVEGRDHISGLVDYNLGTVTECVSHCNVTSYSSGWVGGISAYNTGDIENSYASGQVQLDAGSGGYCGGLVGGLNAAGSLTNCYAKGQVSHGTNIDGGLVNIDYGGSCNSSYWDITTSGQTGSACGTPLTTVQMNDPANFVGWDFDNVWTMSGAKANGPVLQWEANIGGVPVSTPLNTNILWLFPLFFLCAFVFRKVIFYK